MVYVKELLCATAACIPYSASMLRSYIQEGFFQLATNLAASQLCQLVSFDNITKSLKETYPHYKCWYSAAG